MPAPAPRKLTLFFFFGRRQYEVDGAVRVSPAFERRYPLSTSPYDRRYKHAHVEFPLGTGSSGSWKPWG